MLIYQIGPVGDEARVIERAKLKALNSPQKGLWEYSEEERKSPDFDEDIKRKTKALLCDCGCNGKCVKNADKLIAYILSPPILGPGGEPIADSLGNLHEKE